ncbi:vesicle-trafficking protein SEC22a-like isoform X2 [Tachypleus tridentatus]|uniref:vesicle-trafficking protein SEC22a-like isoform X2 n=2 Tax=Tachypleus tridentatus TaxID=6853 RepID=UPI003FD57829
MFIQSVKVTYGEVLCFIITWDVTLVIICPKRKKMILFAMIVRAHDGLALTASTDLGGQIHREVQEARRHMKTLARQVGRLDDKCSLKLNPHVVHFITSLSVSFMALCDPSYPPVLAFSFLDEIQKEFITIYDARQISNCVRPYSFIEFDSYIQKTRQRYNNPRSLTTRLNLSNLSTEIQLRPPQQIELCDITSNHQRVTPLSPSSVGGVPPLPSLPLYGIISLVLSVVCVLFNLYRGVMALSESSIEEIDGTNPSYGFAFLLEACIGASQVYLLLWNRKKRLELAGILFLFVILCNVYVKDVRDLWQKLFLVSVASFITFVTSVHQPQTKLPNYNV